MNELMNSGIFNTSHKNRYYVKSIISVAVIMLLIVIEMLKSGSYFDEIICIVAIAYLAIFINKIERRDAITIMILMTIVLIGLLSNIISGLTTSIASIGIDIVCETKLIFGFLMMKYFINDTEKKAIINALLPFAKLFTLSSFVCAIISQFADIGMTSGERYGLKCFKFLFIFSHQYFAVYILIFGILVCNTKMSEKKRHRYYAIAIIAMLFSTKAPSLVFTTIFIGLYFYFRKNKKLKPWIIFIGVVAIALVGSFQINEYLLKEDVPRRLFFEYAVKTANTYFPLGSGFSTFGSAEAAKHYSPLYYSYGFNNRFGMSPTHTAFLNDTYWPMAIGQFGWIGFILFLVVYWRLFVSIDNENFSNERRAFLYGAYIQYIVHAIGAAILSSSAGMIGFLSLSLFTVSNFSGERDSGRLKIHF